MRTKIMMLLLIAILAALNYGIYEKEQIKKHGETLLLELAPFDSPSSFIQGDYVPLNHIIDGKAATQKRTFHKKRGYIVVRPDEHNVAQFVRIQQKENLSAGEKLLLFYKSKYNNSHIMPDSFFFQEGHAKYYKNAKYSVFKFNDAGKYLLVGLADKNKKIIVPKKNTEYITKDNLATF